MYFVFNLRCRGAKLIGISCNDTESHKVGITGRFLGVAAAA